MPLDEELPSPVNALKNANLNSGNSGQKKNVSEIHELLSKAIKLPNRLFQIRQVPPNKIKARQKSGEWFHI